MTAAGGNNSEIGDKNFWSEDVDEADGGRDHEGGDIGSGLDSGLESEEELLVLTSIEEAPVRFRVRGP